MPKEKDLVAWIFRNFINSLKPRKFSGELKGKDHFGNKYYEIEAGGQNSRRARYFEPIGKEEGFDKEIPAEWESWLRGRRKIPPTEEEVNKNYQLMLEKKIKAAEIDAKFKGQKGEQLELPVPQMKLGSFPQYPEYEINPGTNLSNKPSKKS